MSTYELRERIEEVSNAAGGGDNLLTIAVPPDERVGETLERIEEEHAEAEYINADEASDARRAVLERARHLLHEYETTPENGLVVYVGAVEGEVVEHVFDDLPEPVGAATYEWSNEFDVEALETVTGGATTDGLLVVERGGAALGKLEGDRVEPIETVESDVMGKTRAGGQSADRFERDRERQKREFFETVADEAERAFLEGEEPAIDGLLVGGTTVTVEEFTDGEYLDHRLEERIAGTVSVEYASEQGLHQLAEKGREAVADRERQAAHEAVTRFREGLHDEAEEVAYGVDAVERALKYGAVETTLVSGQLPVEEIREYEERTTEEGGELVVPPATESGARFAETFGVAAVLRFPIGQ